jgi:predicted 3-demethylubiquinone-9 3-methyltransferase (glyoxalase superfamily)
MALNGGPHFTFSPAISFMANCKTQEELDELWEKLSEGGAKEQCGWLRDKYGVSWQIVPTVSALHLLIRERSAWRLQFSIRGSTQMGKF